MDHPNDNVLKPVPQPPSGTRNRLEGGLWNQKLDAVFLVAQTMSMRSIDPNRRWGSRGEEQPPWWGSGAKPQELATNCTYKHQFYIKNCYFSTKMSKRHSVTNLLEPACDMLARGRPTAGTGNSLFLHRWNHGTEHILPGTRNWNGLHPGTMTGFGYFMHERRRGCLCCYVPWFAGGSV